MYRRTRQRPVASCPCVPPVAACLLKTCFRRFAEPEAKGAADRYSITHATDDCYCKSTMTVDPAGRLFAATDSAVATFSTSVRLDATKDCRQQVGTGWEKWGASVARCPPNRAYRLCSDSERL